MSITLCFIKQSYFIARSDFQNILDPGDVNKQAHRAHLSVKISSDGNDYYIPLRNNLGPDVRVFGRIGHSVPSNKRSSAGLDYRYTLIVNDAAEIEIPTTQKIPKSQLTIITDDFDQIQKEFEQYLKGFKKAARKKRIEREPLYRVSSLVNFLSELGL